MMVYWLRGFEKKCKTPQRRGAETLRSAEKGEDFLVFNLILALFESMEMKILRFLCFAFLSASRRLGVEGFEAF
jgi:hypothetical protein